MTNDEAFLSVNNQCLEWAVVGASGFVGEGIVSALQGHDTNRIRSVRAPRLTLQSSSEPELEAVMATLQNEQKVSDAVSGLAAALSGVDVVINAAGLAAPDSTDANALYGANSLLPVVIAEAAKRAGVHKFLHISSAAVQGNRKLLDESSIVAPFSAYSRSKALGEKVLTAWSENETTTRSSSLQVVIIRATSVQGVGRRTTTTLQRIASSALASVAKPGDQPSVVSSLAGLAGFVVTVGKYSKDLPLILIQPWEGASVRTVMQLAGEGRNPLMIPEPIARTGVSLFKVLGLLLPSFNGLARRLEVMWFGQRQVAGWAVESGLVAAPGLAPSDTLSRALRSINTVKKGA